MKSKFIIGLYTKLPSSSISDISSESTWSKNMDLTMLYIFFILPSSLAFLLLITTASNANGAASRLSMWKLSWLYASYKSAPIAAYKMSPLYAKELWLLFGELKDCIISFESVLK